MKSMWLDIIFAGVQGGMEHGDSARLISAERAHNLTKSFFVNSVRFRIGEFIGTFCKGTWMHNFADAFNTIVMTTIVVTNPIRDFGIVTYVAQFLLHFGFLIWYMHTKVGAHFSRGSSRTRIHRRHGLKHQKDIWILPIMILITQLFNCRVQFHKHMNAIKKQCAQLVAVLGVVPLSFAISTLHFFLQE